MYDMDEEIGEMCGRAIETLKKREWYVAKEHKKLKCTEIETKDGLITFFFCEKGYSTLKFSELYRLL